LIAWVGGKASLLRKDCLLGAPAQSATKTLENGFCEGRKMSNVAESYPDWLTEPASAPNADIIAKATNRQSKLTKPAGSLGPLEDVAITLAGLLHTERPLIEHPHIILFAGDHGVTAEGISAYPSEVTEQMLANFVSGGAAISVLAGELDCSLHVIDVGTLSTVVPQGVHVDKIARGTANFRREAALTGEQLVHALEAGRRAVSRSVEASSDFLILGEMGIGNTSSASAIAAALTNSEASSLVGGGTGLEASRISQKSQVISESLTFHGLTKTRIPPLTVLQKVGGHEIAALAGAFIGAAQKRTPVLVDGFICTAAALAAVRLNPSIRDWLIFSHCSAEPGHIALLETLKAKPLLDLGLRLGEGSGAALALPLLRLACALHNDMATFDSAGVSTTS
jgi:nicotinate-nucleotide--dimethylbenzimidazole phosphoribosyltransferase